jgi:hypothetical protein
MTKKFLVLTIATLASQSYAQLINGGFENPVIQNGGFTTYGTGSTAITGWTVVGPQVLIVSTNYAEPFNGVTRFNSAAGNQSLDLTGQSNTGINSGVTQSIATTAGSEYTVSFSVGVMNSNASYSSPSLVDLSIDGGSRISFTNSATSPSGLVNWQRFSHTFMALSPTTSITFLNGTGLSTNNFVGLDDVSVVPEPATLSLLGLLAVSALRRRLRK